MMCLSAAQRERRSGSDERRSALRRGEGSVRVSNPQPKGFERDAGFRNDLRKAVFCAGGSITNNRPPGQAKREPGSQKGRRFRV